jgi:hypothetical protein
MFPVKEPGFPGLIGNKNPPFFESFFWAMVIEIELKKTVTRMMDIPRFRFLNNCINNVKTLIL